MPAEPHFRFPHGNGGGPLGPNRASPIQNKPNLAAPAPREPNDPNAARLAARGPSSTTRSERGCRTNPTRAPRRRRSQTNPTQRACLARCPSSTTQSAPRTKRTQPDQRDCRTNPICALRRRRSQTTPTPRACLRDALPRLPNPRRVPNEPNPVSAAAEQTQSAHLDAAGAKRTQRRTPACETPFLDFWLLPFPTANELTRN
jgi:hypothetical protein